MQLIQRAEGALTTFVVDALQGVHYGRRVATWTTRRFEEIAIGESASYSRTLAPADIELVAMLTGDRIGAEKIASPGDAPSTQAVGASILLATAVGTQLPGPGARIV
jgi:phosphate acetyltransferase/phosphate butyryltransferase